MEREKTGPSGRSSFFQGCQALEATLSQGPANNWDAYMSDSSEDKIKDIIVEQLGVDEEEVTQDASFVDDLGADSLDTVELVMAFEEEFGIDIPDEDAEQMRTVGDAIKYLNENAEG